MTWLHHHVALRPSVAGGSGSFQMRPAIGESAVRTHFRFRTRGLPRSGDGVEALRGTEQRGRGGLRVCGRQDRQASPRSAHESQTAASPLSLQLPRPEPGFGPRSRWLQTPRRVHRTGCLPPPSSSRAGSAPLVQAQRSARRNVSAQGERACVHVCSVVLGVQCVCGTCGVCQCVSSHRQQPREPVWT